MVHIDADTTTEPGAVRLYVQGQLDLDAACAFGEAMNRAACLRWPVELNLGEVDFIDGCGLSMLMDATRRARRAGRQLTIVDPSRCVCRLIEITHTADALPSLSVRQETRPIDAEDEIAGQPAAVAGTPAVMGRPAVGTPAFRT